MTTEKTADKLKKGKITLKRILCFGDSNTWGHNPVDGSQIERRWTVWAREKLPGYEIVQDGVCGRTTRFGEHDTNGIEVFRERYIERECNFDLIIIMLGTNDTLNDFGVNPKETACSLRQFVKLCHDKYGKKKPQILLVSPIPIKEVSLSHPLFSQLYSAKSVEYSKSFAGAIKEAADTENVYFMDAAEYAEASDIDGIHISAEEHEKLASAICKKIREILE